MNKNALKKKLSLESQMKDERLKIKTQIKLSKEIILQKQKRI